MVAEGAVFRFRSSLLSDATRARRWLSGRSCCQGVVHLVLILGRVGHARRLATLCRRARGAHWRGPASAGPSRRERSARARRRALSGTDARRTQRRDRHRWPARRAPAAPSGTSTARADRASALNEEVVLHHGKALAQAGHLAAADSAESKSTMATIRRRSSSCFPTPRSTVLRPAAPARTPRLRSGCTPSRRIRMRIANDCSTMNG